MYGCGERTMRKNACVCCRRGCNESGLRDDSIVREREREREDAK